MRLLAVAVILSALASVASADDTDPDVVEARRLEAALEYEPALAIVERVIAKGTASTPALLAERHLLAGKLAAGLDRPNAAKDHFARVLVLAPTTKLPEGTSPKITEPFEAARVIAAPLAITAVLSHSWVELEVDTDTLGLVAGIEVIAPGRGPVRNLRMPRVDISAAAGEPTTASALDRYGNVLWTGDIEHHIEDIGGPRSKRVPLPLYREWYVWGGVSLVGLAVGAACASRMFGQQDKWDELKAAGTTDYTVLRDVEARGRGFALAANVSFGVALATGVVGAIMFVKRDDRPAMALVRTGGGYGLALSGGF
jgi:hypothetical protein